MDEQITLFYLFFTLRLFTIFISAANERRLGKKGSIEFGQRNSRMLIITHFMYYIACISERYVKNTCYRDNISMVGLTLYIASILVLYYVIYALKHVWTVKLIIMPPAYHKINRTFLFKFFRHPNYFLNILPELIGLGLFFHSWVTMAAGLPVYFLLLAKRIHMEQKVMRRYFDDYP